MQLSLFHIIIDSLRWQNKSKTWKRRKNQWKVLARIYPVCPKFAERFAIRLLLLHKAGPTSFEDLRTLDGTLHPTFIQAARVCFLHYFISN